MAVNIHVADAEQRFQAVRSLFGKQEPCPECGGRIEDGSDPFARENDEVYVCADCGMTTAKRRRESQELWEFETLRYATDEVKAPPAQYSYRSGQRKQRIA